MYRIAFEELLTSNTGYREHRWEKAPTLVVSRLESNQHSMSTSKQQLLKLK